MISLKLRASIPLFVEMDCEQSLYNNVQNVVLPNGKTKDLRIDVSGFGRPISKVEVRLTDDNDPSLLYILHVTESDFNVIKTQQGLLVEFSNFPVHLVKLLEQCLNSVKGFLLILEESGLENYLKVVQPIDLKNLCYIALRIVRGSDSEVLKHMHSQIVLLKKTLSSKEEENVCAKSQISKLQEELNLKEKQNEKYLANFEEEKSKLQMQYNKEIDALREQMLLDRKRDLDSAAYQRENLNSKIDDLTKECSKYKNKHMQVCEKYEQAQQAVRELSLRISTMEDAHKSLNRELNDLRRHKSELESACHKKDQDLDQARSHSDALDKEVARLRTRLSRQEGQLRQADSEQVRMKTALNRLQETVESRSDLVLQLNGDLTKANAIIKDRQRDFEKLHSEFQKLVASKTDDENKLKGLGLEMKLLRANAERDEARIKALEENEKKLLDQLKNANETISSKDEQHKKCGELISYLNRSLNRQHLDPSPPSTAQSTSVHTALHNSAPSAPILYTLGSSLGRAGAGGGLHISGPPMANQNANALRSALPFSSTPLVASTAAGGTGVQTRRSFPGAMMQPPSQSQGAVSSETPAARPIIDRMTLSQLQSKDDTRPKKKSQSPPVSLPQNGPKALSKGRSQAQSGVPVSGTLKDKKSERLVKGKLSDKENTQSGAYKPSAYFQPNKIITEF